MKRTLPRPVAAALAAAVFSVVSTSPAFADSSQRDQWETHVGQQQYQQLMQQGKIVSASPLYDQLAPVAKKIGDVADPQYFTPFHFILVNNQQPNAFSVPGGNVYVTTGLMQFVHNQDELAGVLCHEVSHDIHHDVYNENHKNQTLQTTAGILGAILGMGGGYGGYLGQMAVGMGAQAQSKSFSREIESKADAAGAYNCAKAGYNPWGMVWLFERMGAGNHQSSGPQWMSDHPKDAQRIADLEKLFSEDPATFAKFVDDPKTAVAMVQLKQTAYAPQQQYGPQQPPQGYGYPQQAPQGYGYPQQAPQGYGYPSQYPTYPPPSQPPPGYGYPQQGPPQGYGYPSQYPTYPPPSQPPPGYGYPQQPPPGYGYPPA
ncbi:MAG: M48 family metalloprotease [Candidatus Eremiobacteraeota bacterium]|nr:M48 family metalloprotease [Candidatus Eremiobacteraeota bacterium]